MIIFKSDSCKKKVDKRFINVSYGFLNSIELCEKCGAPILKFLKKNKLIETKKEKA